MGVLGPPPDIDGARRRPDPIPVIALAIGSRLTHRATRFSGVVTDFRDGGVEIESPSSDRRLFRLIDGGFSMDGKTVSIRPAPVARAGGIERTASGSIASGPRPARVARASRIWVEGIHDAELVERVWGDDLRAEGVVVERLDGADDLSARLREARPDERFRIGVLLDHLVPGSKEQRIADAVASEFPDVVLVVGTPFIDIWQAVDPQRIGISAWPQIPRGEQWKEGVCARLGVAEPWMLWNKLLASVRSYADLHPALVGSVERLIDFVCEIEE
jgi:Protein of unknown function (DUF3097)